MTTPLLDISEYGDAESAAKAFHEWLVDFADDHDGDEVRLYEPDEAAQQGRGRGWTVSWEGGPYEWAIHLTGGESLAYSDLPGMFRPGNPEVTGFYEDDDWTAEPYYKFDLQFFDN